MKRIVILLLTVFMFCGNMFPQNIYNKILNLNRSENHLLVSLTPVNDDYLIVCGTRTIIDNNRKRSSFVAKIDVEGDIINYNFIIDSIYDVYEGRVSANEFFLPSNNLYKYAFDGDNRKFILCEFDSVLNIIQRVDKEYINPSFRQNILGSFMYNNNTYIVGQRIDATETICWGNVLKLDSLGNILQDLVVPSEANNASAVQMKQTYDSALIIAGREGFFTQIMKIEA